VEAALDKRTQMGIVGNLDQYTKFQAANAIEDAANNPGGGAGEAMGIGLGVAVGQAAAASLNAAGQSTAPPPTAGPPPLPQQTQWYAGIGGVQQGPFDLNGLAGQVRSGAITPGTLVWKQGMAQWVPAQQVPELADVFGSVPPPLPPQS
jgi:hypothetical protein